MGKGASKPGRRRWAPALLIGFVVLTGASGASVVAVADSPTEPCYPSCPTPEPSVTPSATPSTGTQGVVVTAAVTDPGDPGKPAAETSGSVLPFTGGDYLGLALLGLLAAGIGVLLVRTSRSRR